MKNLTLSQVKDFMNNVNINHMLTEANFTCPAHFREKIEAICKTERFMTHSAIMRFINELSDTNLEALEAYIIKNH